MLTFLLANFGIPLITGIIFICLKATARVAGNNPITWKDCNEIALDFPILSIGASGSIFTNPKIIEYWGENTILYGILIILLNLLVAVIMILKQARREKRRSQVGMVRGMLDLMIGLFPLSVTYLVIYWGYYGTPKFIEEIIGR